MHDDATRDVSASSAGYYLATPTASVPMSLTCTSLSGLRVSAAASELWHVPYHRVIHDGWRVPGPAYVRIGMHTRLYKWRAHIRHNLRCTVAPPPSEIAAVVVIGGWCLHVVCSLYWLWSHHVAHTATNQNQSIIVPTHTHTHSDGLDAYPVWATLWWIAIIQRIRAKRTKLAIWLCIAGMSYFYTIDPYMYNPEYMYVFLHHRFIYV